MDAAMLNSPAIVKFYQELQHWNYIAQWVFAGTFLAIFTIVLVRNWTKGMCMVVGFRSIRAIKATFAKPVVYRSFRASSILRLVLLLTLFVLVLVLLFIHQDYSIEARRAGVVAVSLMVWMAVLPLKTVPLPLLLRTTAPHLNSYHRWIGRMIFLCVTIHLISWIRMLNKLGIWEQRKTDPMILFGLTAYTAITLMTVTGLPFIRKRFHNRLFYPLHVISFIAVFVCLLNHVRFTWTYIYPIIGCLVIDYLARVCSFAKWRMLTWRYPVRVQMVTSEVVRLEIPLNKMFWSAFTLQPHWEAGQFAVLNIPAIGVLQSHPFSIVSLPTHRDGTVGYMSFFINATGSWTKRLKHMVETLDERETIDVWLHGPYGTFPNWSLYDHILLVCGSVGANYAIPIMEHLHRIEWRGSLHLLWFVRSDAQLEQYDIETDMITSPPSNYQVDCIVTRERRAPTVMLNLDGSKEQPRRTVRYGKSNARSLVRSLLLTGHERMQMYVGACGPESLLDAVKQGVSDAVNDDQVNHSIDLHVEEFGY